MRILMLSSYLPYPLFSGGQVRSYNIIKKLSKQHEITLLSIIRDEKENEYIAHLTPFCKAVYTYNRGKAFTLPHILLCGFSALPFILAVYRMPSLQKKIEEVLKKEHFDVIHVETFYLMHNLPKTKVPVVLFEQNIEYDVYRRIATYFEPAMLRPLLFFDVWKMKKWEEYFWKKVNALVVMSEYDKRFANRDAYVCGNGVDIAFYKPLKREKNARVLFLGNFKWFQSLDAARFIISEIWPRIKTQLPQAKLFIVGKHIPESLKRQKASGVTFDENAPDDTRKIYEQADVLLAPIRAGGGASFKVLESMATGLPVITTPLIANLLSAKDGEHVLIASEDDPNSFAEKTVVLLQDNDLYKQLAQNGRKLVEQKYDWNILVKQLERIYKSTVGKLSYLNDLDHLRKSYD